MSMFRWIRSQLDPNFESVLRPTWLPPSSTPKDGRWSVIVRQSYRIPTPWFICSNCWQRGAWHPASTHEKHNLSQFLKKLNLALPESLWQDMVSFSPEEPTYLPFHLPTSCLDLRFLNFASDQHDRPEVILDISKIVQESHKRFSLYPAFDESLSDVPLPVRNYPFEYHTLKNLTFALCWYQTPRMLSWKPGDKLGTFSDTPLEPILDADDFRKAISSFADLASLLVPDVSLLDPATLPPIPTGERRRPSFERLLDSSNLEEMFVTLDAVIDPIHDLALSVFQKGLDKLAGQACPLYEDNKRFSAMILDRIDRYGFKLFMERKNDLVQVRVDAKQASESIKSNPDGPSARAGVFSVRGAYDSSRGKVISLTAVATFPPLIAARDLEQANHIWAERKSKAE